MAFTELRRKRWHDVSPDALLADGERMTEPAMIADDDRIRLVAALRNTIGQELTPKQRLHEAGITGADTQNAFN